MELDIPAPQSYYVSPLNRCCRTAQITFEEVGLPLTSPFRPVIKEVCLEYDASAGGIACGACRLPGGEVH